MTPMRHASKLILALVAVLLGGAVLAATALGHAKLLESKPKAGELLERSPRTVLLVFDEEPQRAAALLRRSVASEVGLALVVLGVASVLATEPAVGA